jgi:hypothetical protein
VRVLHGPAAGILFWWGECGCRPILGWERSSGAGAHQQGISLLVVLRVRALLSTAFLRTGFGGGERKG